MTNNEIVWIKALLLEEATIRLHSMISEKDKEQYSSTENLYNTEQIFLRLGNSVKVRLNISTESKYMLKADNGYSIVKVDSGRTLIKDVQVDKLASVLLHSPRQALFNLYKKCSRNCAYCPLPLSKHIAEFMNEDSFKKIIPQLEGVELNGIGFTTGIPSGWTEDKMVEEIINIINTIKESGGKDIYISAAPPPMGKRNIERLKISGLNEIRINIEVFNPQIFKVMCPGFVFEDTIKAIENAAEIFGRNKVSTNMVIGLGESDEDIMKGVDYFAERGVLSTLSPLDVVPERREYLRSILGTVPRRPTAKRLYNLALKQKEIYKQYNVTLDNGLQTMCSACGYCNIAPLIDL